ncbi:MAG: Na(+)/H(+) antiporter subunit A [Gammaproteobacteria bacterium CG11_big_fil_rev_8_21_14_0_20_46_22]|nr:MAG: Na(+)/H(+) antiporter subunit A [Gammaproteobacteria bacterium CG12_big_fil_rev_8_21_14_0_65_46_12]PIR11133.1 MAG: Na(+)/H(+) antiporter subunit A [Gammaproteobacteria bacterium CG11_big_fil_rev_8_21_14_0_20_46_22]
MRRFLSYSLAGLALLVFVAVWYLPASRPLSFSCAWLPALGVNLSFNIDGLSQLFILLISAMGVLIVLYSHQYLKSSALYYRYLLFLALFMVAMLVTVAANNLIVLFTAWEATSISSFLLISYHYYQRRSRNAALQGLLVTMFGGLFLLLMAFLLYAVTGTFTITTLIADHQHIIHSAYYPWIFIFFLLAVMTKSAQWPFHFWLPNAMEAPTPVSAYLHSATMVKLGLYLTARCLPLLGGTVLWHDALAIVAMITLFVAGILCCLQYDLKRFLAYSTVMALALVLWLLADGSEQSVQAALVFLCAHALYKAALFLCAGNIDHATGERDVRNLGSLCKAMPLTFVAVLLASASLAGLPPLLGFVVKELVYAVKLNGAWSMLEVPVAVMSNVVFVALALLLVVRPFLSRRVKTPLIHQDSFFLAWPPLLLALLSVIFGLQPNLLNKHLIAPAMRAILPVDSISQLSLWHGLTPSLYLSGFTLLVGCVAYALYARFGRSLPNFMPRIGVESVYHYTLDRLNTWSFQVTRFFHHGRLREYLALVFLFVAVLLWAVFIANNDITIKQWMPRAPWFDDILVVSLIAAAAMTVVSAPYMVSLVMLGVVGLLTTFIFILYSAPDVALTQLLVDILTVVITVLALYRLEKLPKPQLTSRFYRWRNALIAAAMGLIVTLMMLASLSQPFNRFLSEFYIAHAKTLAHGQNVVNVILVDFRAFDTLGETLVVAMAGLGVYILWYRLLVRKKS